MTILISDKVILKARKIFRYRWDTWNDKRVHLPEDKAYGNSYVPNNRASKYMK